MSDIRYFCYPRTEAPPEIAHQLADAIRNHEDEINTRELDDGLVSDEVLKKIRPSLEKIGFNMEEGKSMDEKIHRPVLFGKNGEPDLKYEVDGYHPQERCGIEIEAGRGWDGNAVYRDLIHAAMMVQVDTLALVVPNLYKYSSRATPVFDKTKRVVETLYRTERFELPYDLVLIGY